MHTHGAIDIIAELTSLLLVAVEQWWVDLLRQRSRKKERAPCRALPRSFSPDLACFDPRIFGQLLVVFCLLPIDGPEVTLPSTQRAPSIPRANDGDLLGCNDAGDA